MIRKLKEIRKNNPRFIYSRSMVRKVDPLIYKALEEWDSMAKTTYATDYLQTITQSFDWLERPELSDKEVEERSRNIRRSGLIGHGIDISYNVGLFKTSKQLTFLDKMRGIRFARIQKKLSDVELQNSLVLKPDYYLKDTGPDGKRCSKCGCHWFNMKCIYCQHDNAPIIKNEETKTSKCSICGAEYKKESE